MKAIQLLDINSFTRGLTPVTTTEFFLRGGGFNPEGLFSESIFGEEGSPGRMEKYSFINLHCTLIHPSIIRVLYRLDRKISNFLSTENNFSLSSDGELVIDEDGGVTGISEFLSLLPKIKFRGGTPARDKFIELVDRSYKRGTLTIDKIPVIPPDFRPIYQDEHGNWIYDQLNDIYISLMRKTSQVQSASGGSLFSLLSYSLQLAVIEHDDFIRTKIGKKSGLIRSQLLGKRVDFSGRGVIIPNPDLKTNEIGIPLRMAVSIFNPFLLHQLMYSEKVNKELLKTEVESFTKMELSIDSVQQVIKSIKDGDKIPEALYNLFFEATENAVIGRVVLAKRDPVLHSGSYRAFKPVIVRGNVVEICNLSVGSFNADFDGDQMAIFHPLTDKAQEEARTKMMRGFSGESSTTLTFEFSKEMCVGLYLLSKNITKKNSPIEVFNKDLEMATDPYVAVIFRGHKTTMGKAIINSCLPDDFPFVDKPVNKKVANNIALALVERYGDNIAKECCFKLEKFGFKFSTIMAPSISLDLIDLPDEIYKLKDKLTGASTEEAANLLSQMEKILSEYLKDTGLADLIESGSAKGWGQTMQILVSKGIISDPEGNVLPPIKGSYADGLTPTEYFNAGSGARKGIIDRVINTSDTGYISRKLAFLLNNIEASPSIQDCGVKKYLNLRLTKDVMGRLTGRYILDHGKIILFKPEEHKIGDVIQLKSPIYCRSKKICHTCYGNLLHVHKTPYVGLLAAQIIGERGTQLIMRTFHLSQVEVKKRDILQDVVTGDPLLLLDEEKLTEYIKQNENFLICNKKCKLSINMSNYKIGDNLVIDSDKIWVKSLLGRIEFDDLMFNIILDYPVKLETQNMEQKEGEIILLYEPNNVMIEIPLETEEMKQQILYVERLLGGREIYKDVDHLFNKLLKVYSPPVADMDLIHLEILLSNCLRDKNLLELPARLGATWDPVLLNIKETVFSSSFVEGLAFENVSKSISTGLVSEAPSEPSILERVMTGTLGG
jgi:hypothetical protein